ncbi:MAG: cell envelope integrity protein TolA [Granulosicoccus sp.]
MRKRRIPLALLVASAYPFATNALASTDWQGSYSANGQCFCSGDVPSSISSRIVPTPIGGQTVKQVCASIGKGPGLVREDGLFNYPVYKDAQCGNGPFASASGPRDINCVGSMDGTYGSCQPAGPTWPLAVAYANTDSLANVATIPVSAKLPTDDKTNNEPAIAAAVNTEADSSDERVNDIASESGEILTALAGQSIMIGDDRYFRAREGIPAQGGMPGSRIILDGFVYLKDDENLLIADIYRAPEVAKAAPVTPVTKAPEIAAAEPEKPSVVREVPTEKPIEIVADAPDPVTVARKKLEKLKREKDALADYEAEQERRKARLAQQKQLADQNVRAKQQRLAIQERLVEQGKLAEKDKLAMQQKLEDQQRIADQQRQAAKSQRDFQKQATVSSDEDAVAEASRQVKKTSDGAASVQSPIQNALRLPPQTRASSRDFGYVEAMPLNYDFGGNGLMLEGSGHARDRYQFLGRVGVSDTYSELMLGGGYYLTPTKATRMTVVLLAGIEFGRFELNDEERAPELTVTSSDSGVFLGAVSRFVVNNKFELKGGVGYSSFFGGDATFFGGGYYHVTPRLDVMSRFEIGDNDNLGLGIRYYY